MGEVHITEAELVRDVRAVLEKVQQGAEVIVEIDARPVAVIKAPSRLGRSISECIAILEERGSHAKLDEEFGKDLEDVINSRREPFDPPAWD